LVVVPVVYTYLDGMGSFFARLWGGGQAAHPEHAPHPGAGAHGAGLAAAHASGHGHAHSPELTGALANPAPAGSPDGLHGPDSRPPGHL
ncbi:MAG TPA: hypothetical protein PLW65_30525, partial [Pseudomonadota bacterium]|nr:hypothetical protein [Pseudomonadota bacterium]